MEFTKMHGNGNDFVLLDNTGTTPLPLDTARVRRLTDRRRGIGCDQLLIAERAERADAAIAMRIFNTDGSSARQCGNGLRCFAVFARERGLVGIDRFEVETAGGLVGVELLGETRVRTSMGVPSFEPADIPLDAQRSERYCFPLGERAVSFAALSLGNPHAVIDVPDVSSAEVAEVGPAVQALTAFPQGVNVGFRQIVDRGRLRLRVFERGVGETLACGTGACAAAVAGMHERRLDSHVTVHLPGGELEVSWPGEGRPVVMTGPTAHVFKGEIEL